MQREKLKRISRIEERKSAFASWMFKNGHGEFGTVTQQHLQNTFSILDASLERVFSETDTTKIEELASQLILLKQVKEGLGFSPFKDVIDFLLYYDQFLCEEYDSIKPKESRQKTPKSITESALLFAYCLSRIETKTLAVLGCKSAGKAFSALAIMLGLKPNTIKNMRDEFDPYFDNGRKGWYQRQLKGSRKALFEKYKNVSDDDLVKIVTLEAQRLSHAEGIIEQTPSNRNSSEEQMPERPKRHKIKIESWATKEIRVKGKF